MESSLHEKITVIAIIIAFYSGRLCPGSRQDYPGYCSGYKWRTFREFGDIPYCRYSARSRRAVRVPIQQLAANQIIGLDGRFQFDLDTFLPRKVKWLELRTLSHSGSYLFLIDSLTTDTLIVLRPGPGHERVEEVHIYKPAIYLYPTRESKITVRHTFSGAMGTTYPDYGDGWEVMAKPNGSLLNLKDKRRYEYLFWEGRYQFPAEHYEVKEGFIVKKEETTAFLLKQLSHIGLNEKETNDFIVYWLPVLQRNTANLIRFRINDDIDHSSVLHVVPQPDSWLRVFMEFSAATPGLSLPEQQLRSYPRKGFTLVEWGGGELGKAVLQ